MYGYGIQDENVSEAATNSKKFKTLAAILRNSPRRNV